MSAVFRKGGDVTFLVDEMKAVFDPRGGYFKAGGVYMPSIVAEIGNAVEEHLKMIGMIVDPELSDAQRALIAEKRAAYERFSDADIFLKNEASTDTLREALDVNTLGALTGNQAMQQVKAGLKAIYLSGWQVAADANLAGSTYPDQSLYPVNSVPSLVKRLNNALMRADQIDWAEDRNGTHWLAPIVADAEAGFGGEYERALDVSRREFERLEAAGLG